MTPTVLFHRPFCWASSNLKTSSFQNLLRVSLFSFLFLSLSASHHLFLFTVECDLLTLFQILSPVSFLSLCFPPPQWLAWSLSRNWSTFKTCFNYQMYLPFLKFNIRSITLLSRCFRFLISPLLIGLEVGYRLKHNLMTILIESKGSYCCFSLVWF